MNNEIITGQLENLILLMQEMTTLVTELKEYFDNEVNAELKGEYHG